MPLGILLGGRQRIPPPKVDVRRFHDLAVRVAIPLRQVRPRRRGQEVAALPLHQRDELGHLHRVLVAKEAGVTVPDAPDVGPASFQHQGVSVFGFRKCMLAEDVP